MRAERWGYRFLTIEKDPSHRIRFRPASGNAADSFRQDGNTLGLFRFKMRAERWGYRFLTIEKDPSHRIRFRPASGNAADSFRQDGNTVQSIVLFAGRALCLKIAVERDDA